MDLYVFIVASFVYLMFISLNATTEGVEKESSLIRKLISIPMITLGVIMILTSIYDMFMNINFLNHSEIMRIIGYSCLLGVVLLTWGIYILNYIKSSYPRWRKVLKGIGYFLVTISYYSILETYYTAMVCMPIAIIIGIILMNLDSQKYIKETCVGEKLDTLNEVSYNEKINKKNVIVRLFLTVLLIGVFIGIIVGFKEDYIIKDWFGVYAYCVYYLT